MSTLSPMFKMGSLLRASATMFLVPGWLVPWKISRSSTAKQGDTASLLFLLRVMSNRCESAASGADTEKYWMYSPISSSLLLSYTSFKKISFDLTFCFCFNPSFCPLSLQNPDMLTRKIKLCHINAHITCRLCEGYLIDATTVTECLHTFCRSCLVKYLEENNTCPTCRIVIHQSHPLQYIGHDRTMQDIVYKLVPGLQEAEIKKQRDFYQKLGMEVPGDIKGELCNMKTHLDQRNGDAKSEDTPNKEAGEEKPEEDNDYHRSDEQSCQMSPREEEEEEEGNRGEEHEMTDENERFAAVSICLECNSSKLRGLKRKWIRCSAQATVLHLKKFIAKKLNLTSFNELDILCNEEILGKDHTLKFVVVTRWRFKV
ncbi:hypothetical protein L3Q82_020275, partial [Scortum barcoo]